MNIYVYEDETGEFKYQDSGAPKHIIRDIPEGHDFTLTPIPDTYKKWRWIDSKWTTDDTAN